MPSSRLSVNMGSQVSVGQKYDSSLDERSSTSKQGPVEYITEATNTNARDHGQPDRLKVLFRDHRGYRALSEQKVTEWLAKNKQYYMAIPKDLTEIPEQIFSPLSSQEGERHRDRFYSSGPRSDSSIQNGESPLHTAGSRDAGQHRGAHDKMNHFFQRADGAKHYPHNSWLVLQKSELGKSRTMRSAGRLSQDARKYADRDTVRVERSTNGESISMRFGNKEREYLFGVARNQNIGGSRRNSHSVAPRPSIARRRQSEGWASSGNVLNVRKLLPNMVQNNASGAQSKNCFAPRLHIRNGHHSLAVTRAGQFYAQHPDKRRLNTDFIPINRQSKFIQLCDNVVRCAGYRHRPEARRHYSTLKRIKQLTAYWMGHNESKYIQTFGN